MRSLTAAILGALAVAGALAAIALASGGPPLTGATAPELRTVVANGTAVGRVQRPARRTNATIERAVQQARRRAFPKAIRKARADANVLARVAGMRLAGPLAVSRDVAPPGYWDSDTGRFGPGRWCGPIFTRRTVRSEDGTLRRVRRSHHGCPVPRTQSVRVTVTFAAD